jgi:hydrogenase nickel incorporation protein HypB
MVVKHPFIFLDADVVAINKIDLATAMGVKIQSLQADVAKVNPKSQVVFTNARKGDGVNRVAAALGL